MTVATRMLIALAILEALIILLLTRALRRVYEIVLAMRLPSAEASYVDQLLHPARLP